MSLNAFALWLQSTPLSAALGGITWIIPAVQSVHILAVAAVMGSVFAISLRLLGLLERRQPVEQVMDRFLPVIGWGVLVLLATGLLLIVGEPTRAMFRPVFWLKMLLVLLGVALAWGARAIVRRGGPAAGGAAAGGLLRLMAVLALLVWPAIIFAGRWIGYTDSWPGAPQ